MLQSSRLHRHRRIRTVQPRLFRWISVAHCTAIHWTVACLFFRSTSVRAMSTTRSKIAVAQLCSTSSKRSNLLNVAKCAGWATTTTQERPCRMLFLPECFGFLGSSSEETLLAAEPASRERRKNPALFTEALIQMVRDSALTNINQSPSSNELSTMPESSERDEHNLSLLDGLRTIAVASQLWISAGGMHMAVPDDPSRVYNTHVIVDPTGTIRAEYRKIHLFDVCIPGKVDLRESKTTKAGTELVVCPDSPIGCLGVTVCYDLRFPEMYVKLVQDMGAQVLLVPSAFTVPTGQAHWHTLLRARAIENQCFVIAAAQYGHHNEKRESYGHSLVVDPWGTILVDAGGVDSSSSANSSPCIVTCEFDLELVTSTRERMPVQQHRECANI